MMARLLASLAVLVLVVGVFPASLGQNPGLTIEDDYVLLEVRVPIDAGAGGAGGKVLVPIGSNELDLDVVPASLPGAGGTVDPQAYLAQARLLLPSGGVDLPSLVIRPDAGTLDGPAADALAQLATETEALQVAWEDVASELDAMAAAMGQDGKDALAESQAEAHALAEEAAWIQAMADAASGQAVQGAEQQIAVANALVARLASGLDLLQPASDKVSSMLPDVPGIPPGVMQKVANAQARLEAAQAKAEQARQALMDQAGAAATRVDGLVDEQALIDGARVAAEAAIEAVEHDMDGAQARIAELQALVERKADRQEVKDAAAKAAAALADVEARTKWARDWTAAAQDWAQGTLDEGLGHAEASLASAAGTVSAMKAIVGQYAVEATRPASDAILATPALDEASTQLAAARSQLEAAAKGVGHDLQGGLDAWESPSLPAPGEALTVCTEAPAQVCSSYQMPQGEAKSVVVLVLVPVTQAPGAPGLPRLPGLPGPTTSMAPPSTSAAPILPGPTSSGTTTSSQPPAPDPEGSKFTIRGMAPLQLRVGVQDVIHVTVANTGDVADEVGLALEIDAPVAADGASAAPVRIEPGQEVTFPIRLTPQASGSGRITFTAAGEQGGSAKLPVNVHVAPVPRVAADLAVVIDPPSAAVKVGRTTPVTVHVTNHANTADHITITAEGMGITSEPSAIDLALAPGESVTKQFHVKAALEGDHELRLRVASVNGADLQPMVLLQATPAGALPPTPDPGPAPESESSPAFGLGIAMFALASALALARRRLMP